MDYEQKYKEILAWARKNKARLNGVPIEDVLPELAESEDERIRKALLKMAKVPRKEIYEHEGITKEQAIAYLERQKEQKPVEKQDYSGLNDLERAILRGVLCAGVENVSVNIIKETAQDCLAQMKPAEWSEEDEETIRMAIETLEHEDYLNLAERLKSLRPSWKPNDKDEERLIKTSMVFLKDFADMGYENAVECIDWLKSKLNGNTCK